MQRCLSLTLCLSLCISLNQVYQVGRRRATAQCYYIHCREAERAEQGKHPDESYLKGTFPLLHKQVIEESSMCSSLIVVIELVMDFLELSMSLFNNLSYHKNQTILQTSMYWYKKGSSKWPKYASWWQVVGLISMLQKCQIQKQNINKKLPELSKLSKLGSCKSKKFSGF